MMSIGIGKTIVEFCSTPIYVSVWRERNSMAAGILDRIFMWDRQILLSKQKS